MSSNIVSYYHPGQTDPAIFAHQGTYAQGATGEGGFRQWVIGLTLGGRCHWRINGEECVLGRGDLTLVRPHTMMKWNIPATGTNEQSWRVVYVVFHPRTHWLEWLNPHVFAGGTAHYTFQHGAAQSRLRRAMMTVHRLYTGGVLQRDEWALLALERVLLLLRSHALQSKSPLDARVMQAIQFMHANFKRSVSIGEVARASFLSVSHLSLLFKAQTGVAPMQYLERLRLERAGEILAFTSTPINEVAADVGYADAEYFARRFRLHTGQTPRAFRKASANQVTSELGSTH